jgi:hypothetical protein
MVAIVTMKKTNCTIFSLLYFNNDINEFSNYYYVFFSTYLASQDTNVPSLVISFSHLIFFLKSADQEVNQTLQKCYLSGL